MFPRLLLGSTLALAIGLLAYRRGLLTRSGVLGGVLTGMATFGLGGWEWGLLLMAFLASWSAISHYSALSHHKESQEKALEENFLIAALKDSHPDARREAVEALARIVDSQAAVPLLAMWGDRDLSVRRSVVAALEAAGWHPRNAQERMARALCFPERFGEVVSEGALALAPLIEATRSEDPQVQEAAAHALGQLCDAGAIESLIPLLANRKPRVRNAARDALEALGYSAKAPDVIPFAVEAVLQAQSLNEYYEATNHLAVTDPGWPDLPQVRAAVPALVDALKTSHGRGRKLAAAILLVRLRDPHAIDPLLEEVAALGHEAEDMPEKLLCWIGETRDPSGVAGISRLLLNETLSPHHGLCAIVALAQISNRAAEAALRSVPSPRLEPYYGDDPDSEDSRSRDYEFQGVRKSFALACLGDESARQNLHALTAYAGSYNRVNSEVRRYASQALDMLRSLQSARGQP